MNDIIIYLIALQLCTLIGTAMAIANIETDYFQKLWNKTTIFGKLVFAMIFMWFLPTIILFGLIYFSCKSIDWLQKHLSKIMFND